MAETEERTEAPTSKRRSEAREKGDVARSTEINSAFVLLTGIILLRVFAQRMYTQIQGSFIEVLDFVAHPAMDMASVLKVCNETILLSLYIVMPVCIGIMIIGVVANLLQVGWLFSVKPLEPKLEKIDPIKGFKRLFSMRSLVELVKNILKIMIVSAVVYYTVQVEYARSLNLGYAAAGAILLFLLKVTFTVFVRVAVVMLILAILDYAYQRWEHERKLKMSKQEVKDEHKQMEGDPKVKARVRSLQHEIARRRMMKEVPKATVVVTNPTHLAIALRYEVPQMSAPVVLAKGKRLIAERIKSIARDNNIPIVEDKPLARAMYDKVQPGDQIPMEFYTAVAEILAYIYKMKNHKAA